MSYRTSTEHLAALIEALKRPAPTIAAAHAAARHMHRISTQGWATSSQIEDLLLLMDRRLDSYGAGAPEHLARTFKLPWRPVCQRPSRRSSGVMLPDAMSAADVAQLLIHLEACGFAVDPAPLVEALMPGLRAQPMLTESELSVFWFDRQRHRSPPLAVTGPEGPVPALIDAQITTPQNYRIEVWADLDANPVQLLVHAPRYRRRPPPVETTCPECGWTYERGDRDSSTNHRREHRLRMAYLDPQPHPQLLQARQTEPEPRWVTTHSPAWKHREMYDRAAAFRREFHYSFVQWGSPRRDSDPHVQGFLFTDDAGAIVGACRFGLRSDDCRQWWSLQWIWFCPRHRRAGHLARHWRMFRKRFGEFEVEAPVSDAMRAFLAKHGDAHLAGDQFVPRAATIQAINSHQVACP